MEQIGKIFGEGIRERRTARGFSQEDFADKAQIHRTYASSIERGKVQVSIAVAQRLADALSTPLSKIWLDVERRMNTDRRR
ncbi:MAG: helix-turn-helix transcriptional regulator [Planctomycetaceae bacterium]|nr:helix-turn-helix transcriptional regulator [Planctomycetaceae bacterium]